MMDSLGKDGSHGGGGHGGFAELDAVGSTCGRHVGALVDQEDCGPVNGFAQSVGQIQQRSPGLFLIAKLDDVHATGDGRGYLPGQLVRRANAPVRNQAQGRLWQCRAHGEGYQAAATGSGTSVGGLLAMASVRTGMRPAR